MPDRMNAEEFKEKLLPVSQKLFRLSYRFLSNIQEAEDIVQEVYLKLWSMRHKLDEINKVEAFATTVTKNLCLDKIKARRTVSLEGFISIGNNMIANETPLEISESKENMNLVKLIIGSLPEQMKSIMIMRDMEGYSFEEIQDITGLTLNNIHVSLSRARKQVRDELIKVHEYGIKQNKNTSGKIL
jgi:RNA polymerase sigma-70 factor (ECF subfamily)